ncbi:MAG TPA: succinate dehydrogenase assembly factor 2 [Sulfuricaulis sp.]|nr:succinate dehydrogenase assembly factor 2 [Sulfuricaulis sp.]
MTTESSPPSTSFPLPQGEREASRCANDARQYDRIRWRCRRGLLELDVVLKDFLDRRYPGLTPTEQEAFERLLTVTDETLLAYVQGKQNPSEQELMQIVTKIRN